MGNRIVKGSVTLL